MKRALKPKRKWDSSPRCGHFSGATIDLCPFSQLASIGLTGSHACRGGMSGAPPAGPGAGGKTRDDVRAD